MDLHLKQWKPRRRQQPQVDESEEDHHHHQQPQQQQEEQHPAKFPKLLLQPHPPRLPPTNHNTNANSSRMKDHTPPPPPLSSSAGSTLPLFVPEHPDLCHPTNPSSSSSPSPRMGCYFSLAQWQELELQALIYRYMLSGAAVPPELLHPIRKSLACRPPPPPFLQQAHPHLPYFLQSQPFRFQSGCWGRTSMDPEPGRCRRTDGKKWRCSRDAVQGQKYCERHVHRGRNRSRKPVEVSPTNASQYLCPAITNPKSYTGSATNVASSIGSVTDGSHFNVSGPSRTPVDLFLMNSPSNFSARCEPNGGQVLRHFFDDWPRTLQEPDVGSLTGLSMSIGRSSSSDVSLKLATGDGENDRTRGSDWLTGWSSPSRVAPVGGPLAEALRSSMSTTDHSSPTSVLHRLPCCLAAETGLVTQI